MAHTKGPWVFHVGASNCGCGEVAGAIYGGDYDIATVWADVEELKEAAESNARLLAAAPELLDALKECAELLDDYSDVNDGDDGQPRPNRAMSLLQTVEAVIAKAEAR